MNRFIELTGYVSGKRYTIPVNNIGLIVQNKDSDDVVFTYIEYIKELANGECFFKAKEDYRTVIHWISK